MKSPSPDFHHTRLSPLHTPTSIQGFSKESPSMPLLKMDISWKHGKPQPITPSTFMSKNKTSPSREQVRGHSSVYRRNCVHCEGHCCCHGLENREELIN